MKFRITLLFIGSLLILGILFWDYPFENYLSKNISHSDSEGCSLTNVHLNRNASEDIFLRLSEKSTSSLIFNEEEKANIALTEGLNDTLKDMKSVLVRKHELMLLVHNADIEHHSLSQRIDAGLLRESKNKLISLVSQMTQESISMKEMVMDAQTSRSIHVKNIAKAMLKDVQDKKIDVLQSSKSYTLIKVKQGDTLVSLAYRYYGDKKLYKRIYKVNKERIGQKMQIYANTIIMIPKGDS